MGEGKNTKEEHVQLNNYCSILYKINKKVALYCGRNCDIEDWMYNFDYIKIGSYIENNGSIYSRNTNQKLYKKENDLYKDITYLFWN